MPYKGPAANANVFNIPKYGSGGIGGGIGGGMGGGIGSSALGGGIGSLGGIGSYGGVGSSKGRPENDEDSNFGGRYKF
jgi:hypothetical protein